MNLNRIDLIGRTVAKPEVKVTSNDRKFCIFTLAVNGYKNKSDGSTHVDFIKCIISGFGAETFAKYVNKGNKVRVSGSLTVSRTKKDDKTYENTIVSVSEFEFLESPAQEGTEKKGSGEVKEEAPVMMGDEVSDDDLPF